MKVLLSSVHMNGPHSDSNKRFETMPRNISLELADNLITSICDLFDLLAMQCAVPENIHSPPIESIGISLGAGGSVRPKNFKKCMKLNWNFQRVRGGGGS